MSFIKKIITKINKLEKEDIHLITFVNSYSYLELRKIKSAVDEIDKIYVDGIFLVLFF